MMTLDRRGEGRVRGDPAGQRRAGALAALHRALRAAPPGDRGAALVRQSGNRGAGALAGGCCFVERVAVVECGGPQRGRDRPRSRIVPPPARLGPLPEIPPCRAPLARPRRASLGAWSLGSSVVRRGNCGPAGMATDRGPGSAGPNSDADRRMGQARPARNARRARNSAAPGVEDGYGSPGSGMR